MVDHQNAVSPSLSQVVECLSDFAQVFEMYVMLLYNSSKVINDVDRGRLKSSKLGHRLVNSSSARLCPAIGLHNGFLELAIDKRLIEDRITLLLTRIG